MLRAIPSLSSGVYHTRRLWLLAGLAPSSRTHLDVAGDEVGDDLARGRRRSEVEGKAIVPATVSQHRKLLEHMSLASHRECEG
jgi:hypothetical protein